MLELITLLISISGVVYGVFQLIVRKAPLYFRILLFASCCYALGTLSVAVDKLCNGQEGNSVMYLLSVSGTFMFMLSANYGQLDSVVSEDNEINKKSKRLAFLAPVILGVLIGLYAVFFYKKISMYSFVLIMMGMLVSVPASYYNLKHILMPVDDFGFLKGTFACNIIALMIYVCNIIMQFGVMTYMLKMIGSIAFSILSLLLCIFAVRGRDIWKNR